MEKLLQFCQQCEFKGNDKQLNDSAGDERITSHLFVALVVKRRVVLTASLVRIQQIEPERALLCLNILSAKKRKQFINGRVFLSSPYSVSV